MAKSSYVCVMRFRDSNMPKMRQDENTESLAFATIDSWSKRFAAISSLAIYTPQGSKLCFDPMGNYVFTVPPESCKALNLKP